jgi:Cu-processing system ATP-binding protein
MFNPGILILDEPTAGLDPLAAEILKEKIMAEMQRKKLVMITSHLLSELEDIVSEIVFMQDGAVAFHKSNAALKADTGKDSIAKAISHILREQAS